MKYQICLTIYDCEVDMVLKTLKRKKGVFIEKALADFLGTTKGKNTLSLILGGPAENQPIKLPKKIKSEQHNDKVVKSPEAQLEHKNKQPQQPQEPNSATKNINLDSFL